MILAQAALSQKLEEALLPESASHGGQARVIGVRESIALRRKVFEIVRSGEKNGKGPSARYRSEERAHLLEELGPGGLGLQQHMIPALQRDEPRARDERCQLPSDL